MASDTARRFRRAPQADVLGLRVPVAERPALRLLGLALLRREAAGAGLLLPRCSSVHTFGMRFPLDVHFLGDEAEIVDSRLGVGPNRILRCRGARSVLECPQAEPVPPRAAQSCSASFSIRSRRS